jgi:peptidyl-prolyl cis-trans isomerase A (cyclophilin A)
MVLLLALSACRSSYTQDDPVLKKPVSELTDADLARMVVVVKTNYGEFRFALHPEWAPKTTRHFLKQVKNGIYPGQNFYEVRPNNLIVAGDPEDKPELTDNEMRLEDVKPPGPHLRGAVGLFHPDWQQWEQEKSGGTRFYIMLVNKRGMDGGFNVFGQVIEGMATVDRIGAVPVTCEMCKPRPYSPFSPVTILDVHLEVKK